MEATQEPSEKLIEEMLGFLDSTSEEEEENECVMSNCEKVSIQMDGSFDDIPKKEKKSRNSIAVELKKIQSQFPIWHSKENASVSDEKILPDEPIWEENYALIPKDKHPIDDQEETDWNSKLESNCRRSGNSYVQEVNRAIYGDTTGHPPYGSADYYQMAQNYAIYGKDFLDFPENLTPLLSEKVNSTTDTAPPFATCGNGLYPTPSTTTPELINGMSFGNYNKPSGTATATGAATTSSYYQLCNGLQPTVRPAACSTAYGMFLGNKVTYMAAAPTAPPLVYNQHSSTATNFISNSLANAALATSPAILYSNPMLTTTTQQYLNTFLKETQYLSCGAQGTAVGAASTTGIYERLVYAQMLQQQIYHQTQQQAAAVAAMFQHKTQRPQTRATNVTSAVSSPMATAAALSGLNLCARQAAMTSNIPTAVTTPVAAIPANGSGNDDTNTTTLGD